MSETRLSRLNRLPLRKNATWQGGLVRMPNWITGEDRPPYRPYLPLWASVEDDYIHASTLLRPEERSFAAVVDSLLEFACETSWGGYRPGRIEVADGGLAEHLSGLLAGTGIQVRVVDRLEAVDHAIEEMKRFDHRGQTLCPSAMTGRGMTIERLGRFAAAAKAYYESAPWRMLTDVDLLRIEQPKAPQGMKYAVVLGAGRSLTGLAFYASVKEYNRFCLAVSDTSSMSIPNTGFWQMSFGSVTEIPGEDVDLWEEHDLPLAGDKAYPMLIWFGPNQELKRATAARLAFVESVLWALAGTAEPQVDSGRWQIDVTSQAGTRLVGLSIPDLLKPPTASVWRSRGYAPDQRAGERELAAIERLFRREPPVSPEELSDVLRQHFQDGDPRTLDSTPTTPLEHAQELCYQAFETQGRRRVILARQALAICPDCADAFVLQAELAGTLADECRYYEAAVAAGRRALGDEVFQKASGEFWRNIMTRPYMRARLGLALALDQSGLVDEAIEHLRALLELNREDNQGVRYLLLPRLLRAGRDAEAARLLKQFHEHSTMWAYAQALLAFRLGGDSSSATRELWTALAANKYVPRCILSQDWLQLPDSYSPGTVEEAVICAADLRAAFDATPNALEWLENQVASWQRDSAGSRGQQRKKRRRPPRGRRPER